MILQTQIQNQVQNQLFLRGAGTPTPPPPGKCFDPGCASSYPDSIDMVGAGDPNFDGNYQFSFLDGGGNPVYSLGGAAYGTVPYLFYDGFTWVLVDPGSATQYISVPASPGSPFMLQPDTAIAPAPIGSPNYTPGVGCDPVVQAWLGNILLDPTATPPPDSVIQAVCQFVKDLRDGGILDKMIVVNPVIPSTDGGDASFLAMMYPLIWNVGNTFIPFLNQGFAATALTVNGLVGDRNVGPFADLGFNPAVHWGVPDSGGMTLYEIEANQAPNPNAGEAAEMDLGCIDATLTQYFTLQTYNVWNPFTGHSGYEVICWDPVLGQGYLWNARADIPAFYTFNRTRTDLLEFSFWDTGLGSMQVIDTASGDASLDVIPPATTLWYAFGWPYYGAFPSSKRFSFMAIHEGLTVAEATILYNAVQTMRIAFGGGWL